MLRPSRMALLTFGVAIAALLPILGCGGSADTTWDGSRGPKVVASFAPIYCFAVNVAGPDATVKSVMTNQGPHHFDPSLTDAKILTNADLFLINGLTLDNRMATKMTRGAGNARVKVIAIGEGIDPKLLLEFEHDHSHEGHDHAHGHDHDHGDQDPHVWLGIDQACQMVNGIRDALTVADPGFAPGFDSRAKDYIAKLQKLKADGLELLKDKKDRGFVTFHESLGYFASNFNLKVAKVIQTTPGKEPTAKELDELIKLFVHFPKIRVIAVEPQYSTQSSAKRILEELQARGISDVKLVEIDPLETANANELNAEWYEMKMRKNLDELAKVLK